jgi:hypothetical protein
MHGVVHPLPHMLRKNCIYSELQVYGQYKNVNDTQTSYIINIIELE